MKFDKRSIEAIREFIGGVPEHIDHCANAVTYDLLNGPSFALIREGDITKFEDDTPAFYNDLKDVAGVSDIIEEVYTGQVGDALRAFIANLPSTLYLDTDSGFATDVEPDNYETCCECGGSGISESGFADSYDDDELPACEICDGTGFIETDLSYWYALDAKEVVEALFGAVISREFS